MIDLILAGIIIALLAFLGWEKRVNSLERNKFINALLAKNATELRDLDFVDKVTPPKIVPTQPDLIPQEQLSDEQWKNTIIKETNGS